MSDKYDEARVNVIKIASKIGKNKCRTEFANVSLKGIGDGLKSEVELADSISTMLDKISRYKFIILSYDEASILYVTEDYTYEVEKNIKLWFVISDIISNATIKPLQIHDATVNDKLKEIVVHKEILTGKDKLKIAVLDHNNYKDINIKKLDGILDWLDGIVGVYYKFNRDKVVAIMLSNDSCSVGIKLNNDKIISMKLAESRYNTIKNKLKFEYKL